MNYTTNIKKKKKWISVFVFSGGICYINKLLRISTKTANVTYISHFNLALSLEEEEDEEDKEDHF